MSRIRLRNSPLRTRAVAWVAAAIAAAVTAIPAAAAQGNLYRPRQGLFLIEPIDPSLQTLPNGVGLEIFFLYFNIVWPWLIGSAAGFAVLQAMIGGFMMMMSGGDSSLREQGQSKLLWALAGMLIVAFAGFILRVLNPLFYT